jgi:hypothetical protein
VSSEDEFDETLDAASEAIVQLSDEQLEAELTIAAANPGLQARYEALLAERERRTSEDD